MYGVRKCSSFILLQVVNQFSQHHLLKTLYFFPLYILASFVKDKMSIGMWIYLGAILFHWSIFLSLCKYHTVLMTVLCSRAWSQAGWFLQFHSSFYFLLHGLCMELLLLCVQNKWQCWCLKKGASCFPRLILSTCFEEVWFMCNVDVHCILGKSYHKEDMLLIFS